MFRFPVTFVGVNVVTHQQRLSRRLWRQIAPLVCRTNPTPDGKCDHGWIRVLPDQYWSELSTNDKVGYIRLMREMRVKLIQEGHLQQKNDLLTQRKYVVSKIPPRKNVAMTDE
jgi:hypothetical protein